MKNLPPSLNRRSGTIVATVALLSIIAIKACIKKDSATKWVRVETQTISRNIVERGLLQPIVLKEIRAEANGSSTYVIDDGSLVQKGDLIYKIDKEELREKMTKQKEAEDDLKVDLDVAEKEKEAEKKKYASRLTRDTALLNYAQTERIFKSIAIQPEERRIAEINIALAELDLKDAVATFERMQKLVHRSFAATTQLDPLERKVDSARTYLAELKLNLTIQEKGLPEEERIALQASLNQAQSKVNRSKVELEQRLKRKTAGINIIQARLRHSKADLSIKQQEMEHTDLLAPTSGIVRLRRKINWGSGTWQPLSTGRNVYYNDVLCDIVSPDEMRIELMVHEADISGLSTGMLVHVQLAAYPNKKLPGTLIHLASHGQDRSEIAPPGHEVSPSQQALFKATVTFQARGTPIHPGMSAQVHIQAEAPQTRLLTPRSTVFYIKQQPYVYLKSKREPHPIQGTMIGAQWFHIKAGLHEGEKIKERGDAP